MTTETRQCGTKVRHESRASALTHRAALIREKGASPVLLNVYRCRACGCWHVGNRRAGRKR